MKNLFFLFLLVIFASSCTKPAGDEAPCIMVTVEVMSKAKAVVQIESIYNETFEGTYKKTYPLKDRIIDVQLNSDMPCEKSIKIYLNGEEVVRRGGDCATTEYDLSYNIDNF